MTFLDVVTVLLSLLLGALCLSAIAGTWLTALVIRDAWREREARCACGQHFLDDWDDEEEVGGWLHEARICCPRDEML